MGHGPDAPQGAQDAGARVFDCMQREAEDLLEEAQAEWFCAADRPEAVLEGLRAASFLAAVGVWLAAMRAEPPAPGAPRPGLAPVLPPPRPKTAAAQEDCPALERLRALGARASRLYERAARLDGLLSGREDDARSLVEPRRNLRNPTPLAELESNGAPDARGRQIRLLRAVAAEAWA